MAVGAASLFLVRNRLRLPLQLDMQVGAPDRDASLIEASGRGDRAAFAQIIERYQRVVYAVSYSGVRDRALADDITQDTFVIAWRQLSELRDSRRLAPWLCGIARNLARDARKRSRREVIGEIDDVMHPTTPYDELSEAESERIVAAALGRVPDVYREPLVLHYYEERSVDEVARSLGISAATTNKRLSRGRRYLAECVATVERGLTRHGPRPGLAASVLAVIAVSAPSSHVDASPVKGSTMNKLALAAIITASLGGAGVLVVTAARSSDAHANAAIRPPEPPTTVSTQPSLDCALDEIRAHLAKAGSNMPATQPPTPSAVMGAGSTTTALTTNDCAAVGRHLAELEGDATHGPNNRPDPDTCDKCAAHYTNDCETGAWSEERRNCTLAAADLINAHLCAGGARIQRETPTSVPPNLACKRLGQHLGAIAQGAGMHADVADFPQQIEAACDLGSWSLELRQCFAAATTLGALEACIMPAQPAN